MSQSRSHILIAYDLEKEIQKFEATLKPHRVVPFRAEEFLLDDAKAVVAEAYISESSTKYIVVAAQKYSLIAQNSLLKILEEPPRNIEFILLATTPSAFLPTIKSRLPLVKAKSQKEYQSIPLKLAKIEYEAMYTFIKESSKLKKIEAQALVEALYHQAVVVEGLVLSKRVLENFELAYRVLELNGRVSSVMSLVLMGFMKENLDAMH